MSSTAPPSPEQFPPLRSAPELAAHQARLRACLEQTNQAMLSLSVNLFTAKDWAETRFMIRQLEAEIELLSWVLGLRLTTWLDDVE
jgi:hypothetical protein